MSGRIRTGSARVTLANLTPAPNSHHSVRMSPIFCSLHTESPSYSKNVLAEDKAQATEEQQDEVTTAKSRVPETGNRKLDLRVGRHQ
jgi:hypothetical protein